MTDLLSQLRELADEWGREAEHSDAANKRKGGESYCAALHRGKAIGYRACAEQLSALLPDRPEPVADQPVEGVWLCAKCGYGSEEHGLADHPAYQCVADMRLVSPEPVPSQPLAEQRGES